MKTKSKNEKLKETAKGLQDNIDTFNRIAYGKIVGGKSKSKEPVKRGTSTNKLKQSTGNLAGSSQTNLKTVKQTNKGKLEEEKLYY